MGFSITHQRHRNKLRVHMYLVNSFDSIFKGGGGAALSSQVLSDAINDVTLDVVVRRPKYIGD